MSEIKRMKLWIKQLEERGEYLCAEVVRNDLKDYIKTLNDGRKKNVKR